MDSFFFGNTRKILFVEHNIIVNEFIVNVTFSCTEIISIEHYVVIFLYLIYHVANIAYFHIAVVSFSNLLLQK